MRMAIRIAAAAAMAFLPSRAPAGLAPDPGLFATFQTLCLQNGGREAPAVAEADRRGWMTLPDNMVHIPASTVFTLASKSVRLHTDAQAFTLLLAGAGTLTGRGVSIPADICVVGAKPGDASAVSAVQAWAGVPARAGGFDISLYPFLDISGQHVPASIEDASLLDAAQGGRLRVVGAKMDPATGMMMLIYMAARGRSV